MGLNSWVVQNKMSCKANLKSNRGGVYSPHEGNLIVGVKSDAYVCHFLFVQPGV